MINMLNLFNQENTDIKSGGANVSNYKIEIYKKTYNLFEECDYDNREPFSVNNNNLLPIPNTLKSAPSFNTLITGLSNIT